ncbi:hypothetical protein BC374_22630 [Ensifer sp. LC13]|nr:hypothetical protein BBX50_22415 [Ensifer sp. LC11]OCP07711.1 hypothetical protein BC374_22630 [Ensifer sp. LC13]OCP12127.1 hypothetical protein BC362_06650 [Ensifer sp. LC14]OCP31839.1 hypothetical protein BC364_22070 [Ensifer sp. LC499]
MVAKRGRPDRLSQVHANDAPLQFLLFLRAPIDGAWKGKQHLAEEVTFLQLRRVYALVEDTHS